jgi:hypothetical protein
MRKMDDNLLFMTFSTINLKYFNFSTMVLNLEKYIKDNLSFSKKLIIDSLDQKSFTDLVR